MSDLTSSFYVSGFAIIIQSMKGVRRLESWIARLVEEPFVRLFAGQLMPQDVATHLVRAMEDGERLAPDGVPEVPGRYRIVLHPEDLEALRHQHPQVDQTLATALVTLVGHMDVRLRRTPNIVLAADKRVPLHSVHITPVDGSVEGKGATRDLDLSHLRESSASDDADRDGAYLIIDGRRVFDLTEPLVCLGRALDNDLILEDPGVSRHHARLQKRHGRHVLQDLESTAGTHVNGQPIQETVLHPGDLISLAGVELLYIAGRDDEAPSETSDGEDDTRPTSPIEG